MITKIERALGGSVEGTEIAVLGLTFKPETDDMRDAPSLTILPALLEKGAIIRAHDPQGMREAKRVMPRGIRYAADIYEAVAGADAIVLMTEWNQYRALPLTQLRNSMRGDIFVDLRNVYERDLLEREGYKYHCVGR